MWIQWIQNFVVPTFCTTFPTPPRGAQSWWSFIFFSPIGSTLSRVQRVVRRVPPEPWCWTDETGGRNTAAIDFCFCWLRSAHARHENRSIGKSRLFPLLELNSPGTNLSFFPSLLLPSPSPCCSMLKQRGSRALCVGEQPRIRKLCNKVWSRRWGYTNAPPGLPN